MKTTKMVKTRYGQFRLPSSDDLIARALATYGEWAQGEVDLLANFLAPGDTVFDVGAFIGTHTRAFSQIVGPKGRVISFEASPKNYEILTDNVALGPLRNIEAINKALGAEDRATVVVNPNQDNAGAKFILDGDAEIAEGGENSEEVRLDGLNLPAPKLIKIDVEGAEYGVLTGGEALIRKARPVVFAEANCLEKAAEVMRFGLALDYVVFGVNLPAFREDNFNHFPNDIFHRGTECGLLMVPKTLAAEQEDVLAPLAPIASLDDLALLLLHKPQYALADLRKLPSAEVLGVPRILVGTATEDDRIKHAEARSEAVAAEHRELIDSYRALEQKLLAQEETLEAGQRENRRLADNLKASKVEKQRLELRIEALNEVRDRARVLAKAVQKPPFSAYFMRRKKYRHILGIITGSVSILQEPGAAISPDSHEYRLVKEHFDPEYYAARYQREVANIDDLVGHYLSIGWKRGFDPAPGFSTRFYLQSNPMLAELGVNPFVHFLQNGGPEHRAGKHPAGYKGETLGDLTELEQGEVLGATGKSSAKAPPEFLASLSGEAGGDPRLLLSISHDDYTRVVGGTQLCIQRECAAAREAGLHYLNLHPKTALRTLAAAENFEDLEMTAVLNGQTIGTTTYGDVRAGIEALSRRGGAVSFVLHQMLGHAPEAIVGLAEAAGETECFLWLHDFFSLCPSYNLLRNGVSFCGAPPLDSPACTICVSGQVRHEHLPRMQNLFSRLNIHVLSPSQVTADFWSSRAPFKPSALDVAPHVDLGWETRAEPLEHGFDPNGPLRIGYLGAPVPHKGWELFSRLFQDFRANRDFEFVYLGNYDITEAMEIHPVSVTVDNPDGMIRAIEEAGIDLVVHFAVWPETFSFTTFEALAGGAGVLTNSGSGNVAAVVADTGLGAVLDEDYAAMSEYLASEAARDLVTKLRLRRTELKATYKLSGMAVPFMRERVSS